MPGAWLGQRTWWFRSKSRPGVEHETIQYDNGQISCSCEAWRYKKPGRERWCPHYEYVRNGMADVECVRKDRGTYTGRVAQDPTRSEILALQAEIERLRTLVEPPKPIRTSRVDVRGRTVQFD